MDIKQIFNRLPKENIKKHLANVVNNIAIKIATDYINYVISSRTCGADIDICR